MVFAMTSREQRIEAEAAALWRELYDEAPPARIEACEMLDLMLRRLPSAEYDRLNSPHLRHRGLSWPKRGR